MHDIRDSGVCQALSYEFGVVQAHQTLLHQSKVCRALSYKFGVVQAHRTTSNLIEPLKIANRVRCVELCYLSWGSSSTLNLIETP